MDWESYKFGILLVDLLRDPMQRGLAGAVGGIRNGDLLHISDRTGIGAEGDELWSVGRIEQERTDGFEERDDAEYVDLEVLADVFELGLVHCWPNFGDSSIGNDHVQRGNVVLGL